MKARKKSGANAPKDKSMEYKNGLAKKYAGEEAAKLALYESQVEFITGRKARPRTGAGTYAMHAVYMSEFERKKALHEKRAMGKMNRKERKDYKNALAKNEEAANVIEKTVYLVYPLEIGAHFYRTKDGAENQLGKKYDRWIMSELQCDYENIKIVSMKESEAVSILATM